MGLDIGVAKFKQKQIEENSQLIIKIVDELVQKYSKDLDEYIVNIKEHALPARDTLTDEELEKMMIKIPMFMYYAAEGLEQLGLESDTAKAKYLGVYNEAYQKAIGTINDKKATAEADVMEDYIMEQVFLRAYRKLRTRLDMAEKINSGIKKIISARIANTEIARVSGGDA